MAIMGPADMPVVLKLDTNPIKKYVLTLLGHPISDVELSEDQFETVFRTTGDFIAGYFPKEQRLAWFTTEPLVPTYPMPRDAYWIQEVQWDPQTTNVNDIFGAESYLFNVGNVTGIQNVLTDLHLLAAYRRFSKKILGTEGHWEVLNEGGPGPTRQIIRLIPTPKGAYPVVVLYYPVVTSFRSPQARKLVMDMALAEAKCILGASRRKIIGMPTPDGGSIQYDGDSLVQEGEKMKDDIINKALQMGEPDTIVVWSIIWPLLIGLFSALAGTIC